MTRDSSQQASDLNSTAIQPVLDPETREFLKSLVEQGGPPFDKLSVEEARAASIRLQAVDVPKLPADVEDLTIRVGPGGSVDIRIVRPQGSSRALPAVMYFHGGGWVVGDKYGYDPTLRALANGSNSAVVFVDYTRSPEVRYPHANEEAYAATKWVAEHGPQINVDGSRLAVAGDSAGGNMAAAVSLLAKQRGGPNLALQVLLYPTLDVDFANPSYRQFSSGYFLETESMKWFWNHYAPDLPTRQESTACPLRASLEQLSGLPPALVVTAECDVLRDEGEAYARRLAQTGIEVTATRYLGTIHGFVTLNALSQTAAGRAAMAQTNAALRSALGVAAQEKAA